MFQRAPLLIVLGLLACSKAEPPQDSAARASPPAPFSIAAPEADPAASEIIWRYVDPQSGEVAVATTWTGIPEPARRQVVVDDPRHPAPAGFDFVADLSSGLPTTAVPIANFRFTTRSSLADIVRDPTQKASLGDTAPREVVLFSTQGCGYCDKARKYLSSHRIPFTELDVEEDPKAGPRLMTLGQKAGLSERDLQGVPILFIDGRPLVGWDERRVAKMLGLGG